MDVLEVARLPAAESADSGTDFATDSMPAWTDEFLERLAEAPPPTWAQELLDSMAKLTRVQGRQGLRVEQVESKLEGGLADLRSGIERRNALPTEAGPGIGWVDVLDALDLLCEVKQQQVLPQGCAEGLDGVLGRLDRALAAAGIVRHGELGQPAEGQRFRVVGTEDRPDWPEGVVTRMVRHAATRGNQLVREGEVLINRRAS